MNRTLANSFLINIILITKSEKGPMRKESYRSVSFINIHAKILNNILTNQNKHYVKKNLHHEQLGLPGVEGCFNF